MADRSRPLCVRVLEVDLRERPLPFRIPFRFGAATVEQAPQAFARVRVETQGGSRVDGYAAQLMMPRWFDKAPDRDVQGDLARLRRSVWLAARALEALDAVDDAFALSRAAAGEARRRAAEVGLTGLEAGFGPALLEVALLDAVCRAEARSFPSALRAGRLGLDLAAADPELAALDREAFLARCPAPASLAVRHTVGGLDPLTADEARARGRLDDGLPESLEEAVARYGHRLFKLKLSGDAEADLERLEVVARVLEAADVDYRVTLDGNEQLPDVDSVVAFAEAVAARPGLARLSRSVLHLEQPLPRSRALDGDVRPVERFWPVVIDESDDDDHAFLRARACGYRGVSSKACKGVFRALLNTARCALWNGSEPGPRACFVCAEDLTTPAGLAVQQDLVLAACTGASHVERNGHHFAPGMPGAPRKEWEDFELSHPDLYRRGPRGPGLVIRNGRVSLRSLYGPGFGSSALPDPSAMERLEESSPCPQAAAR